MLVIKTGMASEYGTAKRYAAPGVLVLTGMRFRIFWMRDLFDVSETDACETSNFVRYLVAIESNRRHPHSSFIVHDDASTRDRFLIVPPVSKTRCWNAHTICEARRQRPAPDYFALA
jgi:hypothetical protein